MIYHIPSDEQIQKSLGNVLNKYRTINSQIKLRELIIKDLKTKKMNFGVSGHRIRNIAVKSDFVKLEIHTREGDPKKIMTRCPVCSDILKRVKNLTIWGGEVTIEFRCANCGYWTGKKKRIPTRYIFHIK